VVTQNQGNDDQVFQPGAHVMVQTQGSYQRFCPLKISLTLSRSLRWEYLFGFAIVLAWEQWQEFKEEFKLA
jgi:hypothetical protein